MAMLGITGIHAHHMRWLTVSVIVIALDQLTKWLIVDALDLYERIDILPVFDLVRLHNTGAAFSFLANASGWQNTLFAVIGVAVSLFIGGWILTLPGQGRRVLGLGLALLLGGAIGNIIDRIIHGHVIDFLLVYYQSWSYPAFNIADSAITCGVALMLYDGLVLDRKRRQTAA